MALTWCKWATWDPATEKKSQHERVVRSPFVISFSLSSSHRQAQTPNLGAFLSCIAKNASAQTCTLLIFIPTHLFSLLACGQFYLITVDLFSNPQAVAIPGYYLWYCGIRCHPPRGFLIPSSVLLWSPEQPTLPAVLYHLVKLMIFILYQSIAFIPFYPLHEWHSLTHLAWM